MSVCPFPLLKPEHASFCTVRQNLQFKTASPLWHWAWLHFLFFFSPFCCYRLHPTPHLCYCPICTYCSLFSSGKPIIADLRVKCLPRDVPGAGLNQHCVNSSAKACNECRFTCKRSTSSLSWNEVTKSILTL